MPRGNRRLSCPRRARLMRKRNPQAEGQRQTLAVFVFAALLVTPARGFAGLPVVAKLADADAGVLFPARPAPAKLAAALSFPRASAQNREPRGASLQPPGRRCPRPSSRLSATTCLLPECG